MVSLVPVPLSNYIKIKIPSVRMRRRVTVVCLSAVCVSVCVCVCYHVTGGYSFIYGFKVRYQRLVHDVLLVFISWISLEVFRSRVRA